MDITGFITLLQDFSLVSYVIMFIIAFLEVFVVIGAFFPGQNLIIASGFLAQQGAMEFTTLVLVVFTGTFVGSVVSYYLGRIYGDSFLLKFGKYFYLEKKHFDIARSYMKQHSGKTLFIGRFNHITRAFIPFIAGSTGVGIFRYLFYTITGSIVWSVVFVGIGYILGRSFELAFGYAGIVSIVALIVVSGMFYWFFKKTYKNLNVLSN